MEMQEAIRGYLMCVEAREDTFSRCTIITIMVHGNFTLPCQLIFLARKSLLSILDVHWPFDRPEFVLFVLLHFILIFRHIFVSKSE